MGSLPQRPNRGEATERALRPLAGLPPDRQIEAARGALRGFVAFLGGEVVVGD
jgi:hypothetical protein